MLSPDLQRIKHILDYCNEVKDTIDRFGNDFDIFDYDHDYQRSIAFAVMQIGELSGGLSEEFRKSTAGQIQWGPMRAMRNYFAHAYAKMDRKVIWETATIDIPALSAFCKKCIDHEQLSQHNLESDCDLEP